MANAIPGESDDVAARIAQRSMASRGADYSEEVRRLLEAGRTVMYRCGTRTKPRVADIVAEAGLSNDAFYRHFASKDALVRAVFEDGITRLRNYLAYKMGKERTPEGKVRRWVEGLLSQANDEEIAATTLSVLWNSGSLRRVDADDELDTGPGLAVLLHEPFAELGSSDPELDASLVSHAVFGQLSDYLWRQARPTRAETAHIVAFCLAAVAGTAR